MLPLESFGQRIIVLGPSSSGKSTLAAALGQKLRINPVHLDQLSYQPDTNWQKQNNKEFARRHAKAIAESSWVMDGNYSSLLPPRLNRCTGVVLLNANKLRRTTRYAQRIFAGGRYRHGAPQGSKDRFSWEMLSIVLSSIYSDSKRYAGFVKCRNKPTVQCLTTNETARLYTAWGLERPQA